MLGIEWYLNVMGQIPSYLVSLDHSIACMIHTRESASAISSCSQDIMAKPGVSTGPLDPQWGSWTLSVSGDYIAYIFQSREVSCLEVHVNETKMKSPYTSEVIDLNRLSLLFALWRCSWICINIWSVLVSVWIRAAGDWGVSWITYLLIVRILWRWCDSVA